MRKNITFSAEEELINRARRRAKTNNTTLNDEFRRWLNEYVSRPQAGKVYKELMEQLDYVKPGRTFTREDMNER
jgi:hypothetical protein